MGANQREEAYKEQIKTLTAKLKQAPSSPRSPSRSSRRRSTGSRTSWSTRWRSSRPSPTSSTRPLPRCLATKHSPHLLPTEQKSYFLFYLQVFASQTRSQVSLRLKLLFNDFSACYQLFW